MIEQGDGLGPALTRLYERRRFGVKPGLEVVRSLCALTGHPENSFAAIHIAGTNGKGSTAAMIESVLRTVGIPAGLYTSPHLIRFNERVRLQGIDADDRLLAEALARCESVSAQVTAEVGQDPTFFEIATVMAFLCMQSAGIRLGVIETGLGGRLDATNVVTPLVSVITRIGMDHEQYLGSTLSAIAREKAGIIKAGRPVVSAPQDEEAADVLRSVAETLGSPLVFAPDVVSVQAVADTGIGMQKVRIETQGGWSGLVDFSLSGVHQIENLGVALAALEVVFGQLSLEVGMQKLRSGLLDMRWAGRMQCLAENPRVILDVAHNPDGARVLVKSLHAQGIRRVILVTGMCADKDMTGFVRTIAPIASCAYCCPISGDRGVAPGTLACEYQNLKVQAAATQDIEQAIRGALERAQTDTQTIVIAGSIFLAGVVLDQWKHYSRLPGNGACDTN